MNNNIYSTDIDELDTFEAHFDYQILRNNSLILKYVNLGVSEHPLNPTKKLKYLNYSCVLFVGITKIEGNFPVALDEILSDSVIGETYFFGGKWVKDNSHREFSITCNHVSLYLLENSLIQDFKWNIDNDKTIFLKKRLDL